MQYSTPIVRRQSLTEADNCPDIRLEVADSVNDLMSVWKEMGKLARHGAGLGPAQEAWLALMFPKESSEDH